MTLVSEVHSLNILPLRTVRLFGTTILVSEEQPINAPSPKEVTLLGMVTLVTFLQ